MSIIWQPHWITLKNSVCLKVTRLYDLSSYLVKRQRWWYTKWLHLYARWSIPPLKDAINCIHGHNDAPFHPASLQNAFMVFQLLVHLKSDRSSSVKNSNKKKNVKWPLLSCFGKFQTLWNTATLRGEGKGCYALLEDLISTLSEAYITVQCPAPTWKYSTWRR